MDRDLDTVSAAGLCLPKAAQKMGKHVGREGAAGSDRQSARRAGFDVPDRLMGFPGQTQNLLGITMKGFAGCGQNDTLAQSVEKPRFQLRFQGRDLPRDGGLCEVERFSGTGKTFVKDNRLECL